jgi:hypothetical protein
MFVTVWQLPSLTRSRCCHLFAIICNSTMYILLVVVDDSAPHGNARVARRLWVPGGLWVIASRPLASEDIRELDGWGWGGGSYRSELSFPSGARSELIPKYDSLHQQTVSVPVKCDRSQGPTAQFNLCKRGALAIRAPIRLFFFSPVKVRVLEEDIHRINFFTAQ